MGFFTQQLVLCCLLSSVVVWAADPPTFVYRADFRPPEVIFANGFPALGDNDDLHDHMTGGSCKIGNNPGSTAFVATTSDERFAVNWGRDRIVIRPPETQQYYVYKIRATANFYNAEASLRVAYHNTGDRKYSADADHYAYQKEWLAYNGIPASQVEMVTIYGRPDRRGNVISRGSLFNENYDRRSQSSANPNPYVPRRQPTHRRRFRLPKFVTACFNGNNEGDLSKLQLKNRSAEAKISTARLMRIWKTMLQHASRMN